MMIMQIPMYSYEGYANKLHNFRVMASNARPQRTNHLKNQDSYLKRQKLDACTRNVTL